MSKETETRCELTRNNYSKWATMVEGRLLAKDCSEAVFDAEGLVDYYPADGNIQEPTEDEEKMMRKALGLIIQQLGDYANLLPQWRNGLDAQVDYDYDPRLFWEYIATQMNRNNVERIQGLRDRLTKIPHFADIDEAAKYIQNLRNQIVAAGARAPTQHCLKSALCNALEEDYKTLACATHVNQRLRAGQDGLPQRARQKGNQRGEEEEGGGNRSEKCALRGKKARRRKKDGEVSTLRKKTLRKVRPDVHMSEMWRVWSH
jgi:hypothetical protein